MSEEDEDDFEKSEDDDAEGLGSDGTFGDLDDDEDEDGDGEDGGDREDDDEDENNDDDEDGEAKGGSKKKLIAIIAGAVVLLLLGGGTAYFMGFLGGSGGSKTAELVLGTPVTHELPQLKADLKTGRCRAPFIRLIIAVQLNSESLTALQLAEVKIMDRVQMHLREQERQDLVGKEGTNKLRFDIANIVNNTIAPARITAVLFKEIMLQ